jgi:hypothetical protein
MQKITGTFSNIHVGTDTKTKFVADSDQQEFNFIIDNLVPFDNNGFKYLFNYNIISRITGVVDFTCGKGYIQVSESLNLEKLML